MAVNGAGSRLLVYLSVFAGSSATSGGAFFVNATVRRHIGIPKRCPRWSIPLLKHRIVLGQQAESHVMMAASPCPPTSSLPLLSPCADCDFWIRVRLPGDRPRDDHRAGHDHFQR